MYSLFYAAELSGIVDDYYIARNFALQNYTKKMTYARTYVIF